ncbi:MAG: AAA family ATPase [Chloroflexota bacterium]|nr:AAA family ATPase [Chloroflexota bacterium]MDE2682584.1 AAA family ATPase [Chloroflexota bacterium]
MPRPRGKFWTAGGLRPKDLSFLRTVHADGMPARSESPCLVVLCGLPGTGKSHFARELASRAPFVWLNSDRTRKLLVARPQYSRREHRRVFAAMHVLTRGYLRDGYSVVFDATNLNENVRLPLYAAADDVGVEPVIIRFTAHPNLIRKRMAERESGVGDAAQSDAGWEVYSRMAVADLPVPRPHILVQGPEDMEEALAETLRRLGPCKNKR